MWIKPKAEGARVYPAVNIATARYLLGDQAKGKNLVYACWDTQAYLPLWEEPFVGVAGQLRHPVELMGGEW